ncbi:MAG: MATE family efflux transporter [Candidatus Eremiobacteraeota bacterium]|nr:MATE family efflux transporter [Candidatus Eremiobacteraeota bacterium]MBV9056885.1 MATE family efflux transporter [Candidatus Eremiobacteraeota bacterium]MBV9698796.1 MATE family efflux transporter [Candidatus Eremiobacteraeota bacterium]
MAQARAVPRRGVNIFEEGKPMWQILLVFLVPLMLSNVLQSASQTMASIWIGRLISTQALGAISAVFPIVFLLFSFVFGVSSGASVLIGQAYGARDHHKVKKIAGTVIGAGLYLGIIVAILGFFGSPTILDWLRTPHDILASSDAYARVLFLTMPVFFVYFVYATILRGTGDSTTPFYALIVSAVLAIVITPVFIVGLFGLPKLGVVSAALAGFIANAAALGWLLYYLNRHDHPLKFDRETLGDMLIDWSILRSVVRIGVPTGIQVMMVSLAEIAVISFVNRFGSSATAAYGAVNQVVGYVQFPAISIGISASIFGAQCIGARREDKLGSVIRSAVGLNYVVGGIIIGLCYLFAWQILGWFITDVHTLDIAHELLMITLWSYLLFGNSAVLSGVMRGSGTVLWPTINGIFAIWGVEVPAAYLLMHYFGLKGVWLGYPIAYCVVLALQFSYYQFVWKRKTHERLV